MTAVRAKPPTESQEQQAFMRWFRLQYPDVLIAHIPNGAKRSKATRGRAKAEGLTAGVPDILIPEWLCWIEMKRTVGGRLSPAQRLWLDRCERAGWRVYVAKGWEDARDKVKAFVSERGANE